VFRPRPIDALPADITAASRQIMKAMADYASAVKTNSLNRLSESGKPYTLTL
jgi:hypothetical protein